MSGKSKMLRRTLVVCLATCSTVGAAQAAVSANEAAQLGATLTEFGAEKAGNADGSIPPYTGGVEKVQGYDPATSQQYVDPFKDERPLYSVDAKNMAKYDELLTPGTKAMFQAHPDFRVDVYPAHRSVRYPDRILANIVKNATTVNLTGEVAGDGMTGADNGLPFRGIPFPIPKNGYEVMWNHNLHASPALTHKHANAYLVDTAGGVTDLPGTNERFIHPWYDDEDYTRSQVWNAYLGFTARLTDPPSSAGIVFLNYYLPTADDGGQKVWFYTPGQRRVRAAPEFSYDVPIASYGGVIGWDELFGNVGRFDRFDFKLAGKKEMIVPYNVFGPTNTLTHDQYLGAHFINPDAVRFEKHRVWVVDATRKPDARHAYSRRTFYVDEDSWAILGYEAYDDAGKLWKVTYVDSYPTYGVGGLDTTGWTTYDLIKGNYFIINVGAKEPGGFVHDYATAKGQPLELTPQAVAAASVR